MWERIGTKNRYGWWRISIRSSNEKCEVEAGVGLESETPRAGCRCGGGGDDDGDTGVVEVDCWWYGGPRTKEKSRI